MLSIEMMSIDISIEMNVEILNLYRVECRDDTDEELKLVVIIEIIKS